MLPSGLLNGYTNFSFVPLFVNLLVLSRNDVSIITGFGRIRGSFLITFKVQLPSWLLLWLSYNFEAISLPLLDNEFVCKRSVYFGSKQETNLRGVTLSRAFHKIFDM